MLRLQCAVQNYAWGKRGKSSEVAKLYSSGNDNASVEEEKPYAELWMGTHPSGPSYVSSSASYERERTTLKSWIEENESSLGQTLLAKFGKDLPFLFKVLSVRTALSIQAHPHKALAKTLHGERPHVYKDDNHKPEMTLALTEFEALSCFVSHEELHTAIVKVPELAECIGKDRSEHVAAGLLKGEESQKQEALKEAFRLVMKQDGDVVKGLIARLVSRLNDTADLTAKEKLILRLNSQYPGDVGIFAAYFLNYIKLQPSQAIFLEANEPHAYLSGNCVEVMATSDNVVRAGLTPKLRDTDVLCGMLTYKTGMPTILDGQRVTDHMKAYKPPFDEFQINVVELNKAQETLVEQIKGPLLVLVYEGKGEIAANSSKTNLDHPLQSSSEISKGDIFFVLDGQTLNVKSSEEEGCTLFIASANARIF